MTQEEIEKLRVINQTIDKLITIKAAAKILDLSERQVIRLKGGVMQHGPAFLIHKNRGRLPAHAVSDELAKQIIDLKQTKYAKANFAHFQELLEEQEGISVSYPTVYRTLSEAHIKSPKTHRKKKSHHRRKRQEQAGMLVQIDASPHEWIPGLPCLNLHGAIDDATGEVLGLFLTKNECLHGYFQVMEQMLRHQGRPVKLYCDRHTIFFSPKDEKISMEEQLQGVQKPLTQFGRSMQELGIQMIKARTAQAKGRIERLWNTLQSRLPVLFELNQITSIEQANVFLLKFMEVFNEKFAVEAQNPVCAYRPVDSDVDLGAILCVKHTRTLIDGGAFSYGGLYYQLRKNNVPVPALPKTKVTVLEHPSLGICCAINGELYQTEVLPERPKKSVSPSVSSSKKSSLPASPPEDHPWRQISRKPSPSYGYEKDTEILAMLDELFSSVRAWA